MWRIIVCQKMLKLRIGYSFSVNENKTYNLHDCMIKKLESVPSLFYRNTYQYDVKHRNKLINQSINS